MKIIIFDMDGVLVHSNEAHATAYNLAFEKNNLRKFANETLFKHFGPPANAFIKELFPKITKRKLDQVIEDKKEFLLNETFKLTKPIEGVERALELLKKKYKLALVTNSQHDDIFSILKAGGIDARLFDAVIGANDIPKPKPNPAVVKKVETLLKGEVEFVVGDQLEDVKLAANANVRSIGIDSGLDDLDDLADAGAEIIVKSVALLPEVLL